MEKENRLRIDKVVEKEDTAAHYGSGLLPVFATPGMIALMEKSAHLLAKTLLSEEEDTVGIEINVRHIRATPMGAKVYAEAILVKQEAKRFIFEIRAYDEKGEIGNGTHVRYMISPTKFMEKLF